MASTGSSTLKLVIDKGPRSGETLEFNPKSTVRIGRLVRGNNLQIKDAGISSKHLSIEFNSDSGKWVITDLDSSNGTLLNSSQLKPLSPSELRTGDEIKIGELTSMRVEILEIGGEMCNHRNPRRQAARNGAVDLGAKVEAMELEGAKLGKEGSVRVRDLKGEEVQKGLDSEVNLGRETRKGRARGQPKKESILSEANAEGEGDVQVNGNVEDVKPKQEGGVATRTTRSSKREGIELLSLGESMLVRMTRSMKNVEKLLGNEASDVGNVSLAGSKKARGRGRKKKLDVECSEVVEDGSLEDMASREVSQLKVADVREVSGVGKCKEVENVSFAESKKSRGRGRKKKMAVECSDAVKDVILEDMTSRETSQLGVLDVREQPNAELMGDTSQEHPLEGKMSREASHLNAVDDREQPQEEPMCYAVRQDVLQGKTLGNVSDLDQENVGVVKDANVQACGQPSNCTAQEIDNAVGSSHFEPVRGVIDVKVQACELAKDSTAQEIDNAVGSSNFEPLQGVTDVKGQPCEQQMDNTAQENDISISDSQLKQDSCKGLESDAVMEDGRVDDTEMEEDSEGLDTDADGGVGDQEVGDVPDLEKMTLGEWFDYLEAYLPKQIRAVTDEIIVDMQKRAKQFDDFMLQQKKEKGKFPVTT